MKRSFRILFHAGFWLGYLLLVSIVMFAALQGKDIPPEDWSYYISFVLGGAIIPAVTAFYSFYAYLFGAFLQRRKIVGSVVVGLLLAGGATLLGFLFISLTNDEAFGCVRDSLPYATGFTMGISSIFGVIALVIKGFLTWYEELKLKEELLEKTHRMELALVKSQLDPHFLFNTINNIDILISKDPDEASRYLNKLSDIMRFMLYETKGEKIPLAKELEYIEKYIQLQRIRTANDQYVNYRVAGADRPKKIAPMVFIPFIENAFKHSVNKKVENAVDIDIRIGEETIEFNCKNKFDPGRPQANGHNGLGNELIAKRLELLYPERHTLAMGRQDDEYYVALTIRPNGKV